MSKSWIAPLSGAGLLVLASMALSPVNAAVAGDEATATGSASPGRGPAPANAAYASEVPERDVIDNKDGTALAADQDDGSIPVAEELDFVRDNSFRKTFEQSLKTVADVTYHGTRYVGCEQYPREIIRRDRISSRHSSRPQVLQRSKLASRARASCSEASRKDSRRTTSARYWRLSTSTLRSPIWRRDIPSSDPLVCRNSLER